MPIRVRSKAVPARDLSPVSARLDFDLPDIAEDDTFRQVVRKLSLYVRSAARMATRALMLTAAAASQLLCGCHRAAEHL